MADMFGYKDVSALAVGCGVHFKSIPHSGGGGSVQRGPDAALICVRDHIHVHVFKTISIFHVHRNI